MGQPRWTTWYKWTPLSTKDQDRPSTFEIDFRNLSGLSVADTSFDMIYMNLKMSTNQWSCTFV